MRFRLVRYESIDSTNTEAIRQASLGAAEGLCIVSREQTSGRGRRGRTWISALDSGLYFSIVLRPGLDPQFLGLITLAAGIAVHDTLELLGLDADIKWVNDVLVGERKIAGILAETCDTPTGLAVVVGIGINIRNDARSPANATSIETETGHKISVDDIVSHLTPNLSRCYDDLMTDTASIIEQWRERSSYYSGKRVRVVTNNDLIEGVTDGLETNGALRVRLSDGGVTIIQAGDVERLRAEHPGETID